MSAALGPADDAAIVARSSPSVMRALGAVDVIHARRFQCEEEDQVDVHTAKL
jgi:hypothetical protein